MVPDKERLQSEENQVFGGFRETVAWLAGTRGERDRVFLADLYLGAGRALVELSSLYGPKGLRNARMVRLHHRRALALAEEAGELAAAIGNDRLKAESQKLQGYCRNALRGR